MRRADAQSASLSPSVDLIKQALAEKGLRQQELANKTGLSKDHISRILLGKVSFPKSRDTLTAIARALDLDPLLFPEYRRQLQVLPESTRRLIAHLKQHGITQQTWIRRIPSYSEGHLQLILRGGSPFPKDPETIEIFAQAAEADPFLFPEYLPIADWKPRLAEAAHRALDKSDQGVFMHLLNKLAQHFEGQAAPEHGFPERLLRHFMAKHFAPDGAPADPELDDALTYLPPLDRYQSEVQSVLQRLYERDLTVKALSSAVGGDEDTLFAILNGQMKLKEGPIKTKLFHLLDIPEGGPA
ncbi:MAG: helix-turn-helix domain-containing protein [Candidatus Sericytochromatia bacterium]